jgi:YbbR domain-containing protein
MERIVLMPKVKTYSLHAISILLAFFVWIYVQSTAETTAVVKSKVHYTLPQAFAFLSMPVKEVSYTLTGPRAVIRGIEKNPAIIKINLSSHYKLKDGKKSNNYEYNVQNLDLNIPLGIKVGSTIPSVIKVELDELQSKRVPIKLQKIGAIAIDHQMVSQKLTPDTAVLSGAKSLLINVKELLTEVVDFKQLKEPGAKTIRIINNDKRLSLGSEVTTFSYDVKTTRSNMILKDIPIKFLTQHSVENSDTRVANLMVLAENIGDFKLRKEKIKIVAEIDDSRLGLQTVKLRAELPDGLHLLKVIPETIDVKVIKDE